MLELLLHLDWDSEVAENGLVLAASARLGWILLGFFGHEGLARGIELDHALFDLVVHVGVGLLVESRHVGCDWNLDKVSEGLVNTSWLGGSEAVVHLGPHPLHT